MLPSLCESHQPIQYIGYVEVIPIEAHLSASLVTSPGNGECDSLPLFSVISI
jgi:hypothetical protein